MREDFRGCGRWPDQLLLRISHLSRAAACCTIESLPPHPPLPPGGSSGGNHSACSPAKMRALASSQEEPASGFRSYSSSRVSIIAFSCSLPQYARLNQLVDVIAKPSRIDDAPPDFSRLSTDQKPASTSLDRTDRTLNRVINSVTIE